MHGRHSRRGILTMLAISSLAATGAPAAVAQDAPPVTLRLITADGHGRASDRPLTDFIAKVAEASRGALTIEPVYEASDAARPEQDIAQQLADGKADLAMTTIRAWDEVGNQAMNAVQTPFLIDSDTLADAVAGSAIAADLLASLSDQGLVGLGMWPEEMRHWAVFDACHDPIRMPADLEGVMVRAAPSTVTHEVLAQLGATDGFGDAANPCDFQALEIGLRQGPAFGEHLTMTGDITLWPKMQTLVANGATFERLPKPWQDVLRTAAADASNAEIAVRDTDAGSQEAWCQAGHSVILAGQDATEAFAAAIAPVTERMTADAVTGPFVARIADLKASLAASPSIAAPCVGAEYAQPFPKQDGASPVDGVWVTSTTLEELTNSPLTGPGEINDENWGDIRIRFENGIMTYDLTNPKTTYHSVGIFRVDGDKLSIYDPNACCPPQMFVFGWSVDGDTLTLTRPAGYGSPTPYILEPYTRVDE